MMKKNTGETGMVIATERPTADFERATQPAQKPDFFVASEMGGKTMNAIRLTSRPVPKEEDPLDWKIDALCGQTDPEAFFPEKGGSNRDAKKICAQCDVKAQCLDYALGNDERFGIWGGLSERERRRLRRYRSI